MEKLKFRAWLGSESVPESIGGMIYSENRLDNFFQAFYAWTGTHKHLMRFTGLQDEDGRDIYEGDLITGYHLTPMEVTWQECVGRWMAISKDCKYSCFGHKFKLCRVIGDVYGSIQCKTNDAQPCNTEKAVKAHLAEPLPESNITEHVLAKPDADLVGEIVMLGNNSVIGAPFLGVAWEGGIQPPLGTKLYAVPPDGEVTNKTDTKKECDYAPYPLGVIWNFNEPV